MSEPRVSLHSREVLLDSSSLILLYKANLLAELCHHYSPVIAEEVFREIARNGKSGADEFIRLSQDKQITILPAVNQQLHPDLKDNKAMGEGELKTLHHALSGTGTFIIVDDLQAIRFCIRQDIPFINALLFPRMLYLAGTIPDTYSHKSFTTLRQTGHYSKKVIERALLLGVEELRQFFPS